MTKKDTSKEIENLEETTEVELTETKKDTSKRRVKVLQRDDRGYPNHRGEAVVVYETDETIQQILQHAHNIEVLEDPTKDDITE